MLEKMISIDRYAYNSKLRYIEPLQKLIFSLLTLAVRLWADNIVISIIIFSIMIYATVYYGGIPIKYYFKLLLIPMTFLFISVITLVINISHNPENFLCYFRIGSSFIGCSKTGALKVLLLFFKVMASVSCLYFLSLSTPIIDFLAALKKLKVPKLIIEITGLIYRFIFVIMETAENMFRAQNSRLGYIDLSTAYRSLGTLISNLFIRSYKRANELYIALESRGYDGEINVLQQEYKRGKKLYFYTALINILLLIIALITKGRWPSL